MPFVESAQTCIVDDCNNARTGLWACMSSNVWWRCLKRCLKLLLSDWTLGKLVTFADNPYPRHMWHVFRGSVTHHIPIIALKRKIELVLWRMNITESLHPETHFVKPWGTDSSEEWKRAIAEDFQLSWFQVSICGIDSMLQTWVSTQMNGSRSFSFASKVILTPFAQVGLGFHNVGLPTRRISGQTQFQRKSTPFII